MRETERERKSHSEIALKFLNVMVVPSLTEQVCVSVCLFQREVGLGAIKEHLFPIKHKASHLLLRNAHI